MLASPAFIVSALGITQIISWGSAYYAISVLAKPMAEELGWSLTLIFAGFSLSLLAGGLVAKPVAAFIEARGGRITMTLGSLGLGAGLGLIGLTQEPFLYMAAWALIGFASRLTLYEAAFATLVEIYGTGARRMISVLTLFGGLASTIFWPICHALNELYGWRLTWALTALMVIMICTPLHALMPRLSAVAKGPLAGDTANDGEPLVGLDQRSFAIAMLALALALNSFVFTALSAHFIPSLVLMGVVTATAVWIASIKGVFQTLGRLAELMFGQSLNPFHLAMIAMGGMPLAFLALFLFGATSAGLILFSALYGVANGLVTIVRGGVPLVLFGRHGYARVLASIATPGLIVTATAPTAYALVLDTIGPAAGFVLLFALSVIAFGATIALALRFRR